MRRTKKMTLGMSGAALALAAGVGFAGMASATTTTPTPTPSASSSTSADGNTGTAPDGMGRHGGRGGHGLEQASALAAKLGIDEAKVTAALQEIRSEEQSEHAAELKTRLDKAVADGKLTQAEADAVTKAVQNGVIGGGGR